MQYIIGHLSGQLNCFYGHPQEGPHVAMLARLLDDILAILA